MVGDNDSDRRVIKRHLEKIESLTVDLQQATNIADSLKVLQAEVFDVCLIDYRLGAETGDSLARSITELNSGLPVMIMSGSSQDELQGRVPDNLLTYFLNKSEMTPLMLELSIRHAIDSSSTLMSAGSRSGGKKFGD